MEKIQGIYKIVNCITGKIYIGQSIDIECRFKQHKYNVQKDILHPLYNSFRKYGIENFEFIIVELVDDTFLLDQREQYWLDFYKSYDREFGYNIYKEASSPRGYKHTEEAKLKLSLFHKGKSKSKEHLRKISNTQRGKKRKPFTEEHKINISLGKKGIKQTEEHRRNNSESKKGYKHTEEARKKMSLNNSRPMLGKQHTEEAKQKMRSVVRKGAKIP